MHQYRTTDWTGVYRNRRVAVAVLSLTSAGVLTAAMLMFLGTGGIGTAEWVMFACFALTLPYTAVGFWNACIGLACHWLPGFQHPPAYGLDETVLDTGMPKLNTRTAIIVALRNEDPGPVFDRLTAMRSSLAATGLADAFSFVVVSDSDDPGTIDAEMGAFEAFSAASFPGGKPAYRRREINTGYKAGNIGAFLDAAGDEFDFFVPLDADSFVSGSVLVRMARAMEYHPRLGILQSLVVGMPTTSGFARIFQFGMRHAMRVVTTGSAWWAGDCGAYWGHNAIVRTQPFRQYCRMPRLPGRTPLSGAVLSHDQLEAAYMRRAGYEVRVAPVETESYEINPPNILDFIKRELRWCQGNLQYVFFLGARGLKPVSRIQLALAMLMYIGPAAWIAMTVVACAGGFSGAFETGSLQLGLALFAGVLTLALTPKLAGAFDIGLSAKARTLYGGSGHFTVSVLIELLVSMIVAPIVAVSVSLFVAGLLFNRRIDWAVHNRNATRVAWSRAACAMALHTGFGLALALILASMAGIVAFVIALPFVGGLTLSIPFTVLSARTTLGRHCASHRLFSIPEENDQSWTANMMPALAH